MITSVVLLDNITNHTKYEFSCKLVSKDTHPSKTNICYNLNWNTEEIKLYLRSNLQLRKLHKCSLNVDISICCYEVQICLCQLKCAYQGKPIAIYFSLETPLTFTVFVLLQHKDRHLQQAFTKFTASNNNIIMTKQDCCVSDLLNIRELCLRYLNTNSNAWTVVLCSIV